VDELERKLAKPGITKEKLNRRREHQHSKRKECQIRDKNKDEILSHVIPVVSILVSRRNHSMVE